MVGHADMGMTVMEERVYIHSRFLETRGTTHHAKSHKKSTEVSGEAERRERRAWPRAFTGTFMGKQSRYAE